MSTAIDLRSDTVTKPTAGMRAAMAAADVGDDVYAEDPTCRALEERVAELLGKPAALFTVSGSLANLLGVRSLVPPGKELVCESQAHVVRAELGAHAALFGVTTRTWSHPRGLVDLDAVGAMLAPDAGPHLVSTAAVSVEDTHNFGGGAVQPYDAMRKLRELTTPVGVGIHLDGARLWNAHVASGISLAEYAATADTVAVCLSKGLGAPVGSLVAGSSDAITEARVWRKRLGGGWRQAGVLAAAGQYVLDHHIERLADDHANATRLAERLADGAPGVVDPSTVETNMVVLDLTAVGRTASQVVSYAAEHGVLVGGIGERMVRLVTHYDVETESCLRAADVLLRAFSH